MKPHHSTAIPPEPPSLPVLELLAGNIASGKSTWTKTRAGAGWISVENDALLLALHGGRYSWEEQIPGLVHSLARQIVATAARARRSVVLDATNRSRKQRAAWIHLARALDMKTRIVVFPQHPAEVHAERRAQSDLRGRSPDYWLQVARKIEAGWQAPMPDEADEILILDADSATQSPPKTSVERTNPKNQETP